MEEVSRLLRSDFMSLTKTPQSGRDLRREQEGPSICSHPH